MCIVLYVTYKQGGGDVTFMVNAANNLKDDPSIIAPIYLVSELKEQILANYKLREGIQILKPDEFMERTKEKALIPTLVIEGPCYVFGRAIEPPISAAKLFLTEYSINEERHGTDTTSLLSRAKAHNNYARSLEAGLRQGTALGTKLRLLHNKDKEYGLQFNKELLQLNKESEESLEKFRERQWRQVPDEISKRLLNGRQPDVYHQQTNLYFQYCHNVESVDVFLNGLIDVLKEQKSGLNCDLVSVGEKDRLSILMAHKQKLFELGFTDIVHIDNHGKETVIENPNHREPKKILRFHHLEKMNHKTFLNLLAVAEPYAGLTGDQSFTEGIMLGRGGMYELYKHKFALYRSYIQIAIDLKLLNLAAFLYKNISYIDNDRLKFDLWNNTIIDYKAIPGESKRLRDHIIQNYDYNKHVREAVIALLAHVDPKKECAKTSVIQGINKRIEEIAPRVNSSNTSMLMELEFLVSLRSYIFAGLCIRDAMNRSKDEITSKFPTQATNFLSRFFAPSFSIPSFVHEGILQQNAENGRVAISTQLTSTFDLFAHKLAGI